METKTLSLFFIAFLVMVSFLNKVTFSQWEEQNSGVNEILLCVSAVNNDVCWIGGTNQTVIRTTNGGINWARVMTGSSAEVISIFGFDENKAQCVRLNGADFSSTMYETIDGGQNWSQMSLSTSSWISSLVYVSNDSGLVVGQNPARTLLTVWRTINGGANWDSAGLNIPTVQTNEIATANSLFLMGQRAWFHTNKIRVLYTSNFGNSWVTQQLSSSYGFATGGVWFNTPDFGINNATTVISSTTNSGLNWVPRTNPPGIGSYGGIIGHGNKFWVAVGTKISITVDTGVSWSVVYTEPFLSSYRRMGLARNGSNVWATSGVGYITKGTGIVGISPVSKNLPVNFSLSQNYPNPFNPSTHIRYYISQSSFVKLAVYDILGRKVAVLVNEQLKPGEYEAIWTAENMPSSVYFYKLTANGYAETKRMVVVK